VVASLLSSWGVWQASLQSQGEEQLRRGACFAVSMQAALLQKQQQAQQQCQLA
jgi:hypothetical protein